MKATKPVKVAKCEKAVKHAIQLLFRREMRAHKEGNSIAALDGHHYELHIMRNLWKLR